VPEDGAEHRGAARAGVGGAARGHVGKSVRIPVSLAERSHSSRASVTGCPGLLVDLRVAADAPEAVRSDVAGARRCPVAVVQLEPIRHSAFDDAVPEVEKGWAVSFYPEQPLDVQLISAECRIAIACW
jgi:hypothetical protein